MMKAPAWRLLGIISTLSFLWIVSVSGAYDRMGAFQSENRKSLDFHSWSLGSLNNSLSSPCEICGNNGSCKLFQSSVSCLENGCCNRGHIVEAKNFKRRDDQEAEGADPDNEVADPDNVTEANGKLRRPRSHRHWIAHLLPTISIVLVVVTVVAVAICCYVHITRPDLFQERRSVALQENNDA
uniref:Uncharacterized protein n=1 Tax=Picea sitchensis TaxID=3332 RepID=A9P2A2_PICSI|nr:unknown [Picea sitchensis]